MELQGSPYARRLHDLEERYGALERQIPQGPEKEGISVLHELFNALEELQPAARPRPTTVGGS